MKNADMPINPWMMPNGAIMTLNSQDDADFVEQCKPAIGLTKREHFAAMAMQGLLAGGYCIDDPVNRGHDVPSEALMLADALLAELERTQ